MYTGTTQIHVHAYTHTHLHTNSSIHDHEASSYQGPHYPPLLGRAGPSFSSPWFIYLLPLLM